MSRLSSPALVATAAALALIGGLTSSTPSAAEPAQRAGLVESVARAPEGSSQVWGTAHARPLLPATFDTGEVRHAGNFYDLRDLSLNGDTGNGTVSLEQVTLARPKVVSSAGRLQVSAAGTHASASAGNAARGSFTVTTTERWRVVLNAVTSGNACTAGDLRLLVKAGASVVVDRRVPCVASHDDDWDFVARPGVRYQYWIGVSKHVQVTETQGAVIAGYQWRMSIVPRPLPLVNIARPGLKGTVRVGHRLAANAGRWSGYPQLVRYQWQRNGRNIRGANHQTYRLTRADLGRSVRVRVIAYKPNWAVAAYSGYVRVRR